MVAMASVSTTFLAKANSGPACIVGGGKQQWLTKATGCLSKPNPSNIHKFGQRTKFAKLHIHNSFNGFLLYFQKKAEGLVRTQPPDLGTAKPLELQMSFYRCHFLFLVRGRLFQLQV